MTENEDVDEEPITEHNEGSAVLRIMMAIIAVTAFALGVYFVLITFNPPSGPVSLTFLLVLPAAISAFVTYIGDPWRRRGLTYYLMTPVLLLGAVLLLSIPVLREGVVCVIMLAPAWLASGAAGAYLTYRLRGRAGDGRNYCATLFAVPLIAMQVEPMIPLPEATATVSRTIIVNANPDRIWPLLRGIPDVRHDEGRWNFTQDVLGVPRPLGARLHGEGLGAIRLADWERNVRFGEYIIDWQPGRSIGWRFEFDDLDAWRFTDSHLLPDSPYFRITTGGYRIEPLGPGRTRLTIETRYWMQTPVNAYARLWGELFLGDIENNLLTLIRQRAERGQSS